MIELIGTVSKTIGLRLNLDWSKVNFPKVQKKKIERRASIVGVNDRRGSLTIDTSRQLLNNDGIMGRRGSLTNIGDEMIGATLTKVEKIHNAEYMLSLAQTLGAKMFVAPEDIVGGKTMVVMVFLASLWEG
jgi:hypothetical protein